MLFEFRYRVWDDDAVRIHRDLLQRDHLLGLLLLLLLVQLDSALELAPELMELSLRPRLDRVCFLPRSRLRGELMVLRRRLGPLLRELPPDLVAPRRLL